MNDLFRDVEARLTIADAFASVLPRRPGTWQAMARRTSVIELRVPALRTGRIQELLTHPAVGAWKLLSNDMIVPRKWPLGEGRVIFVTTEQLQRLGRQLDLSTISSAAQRYRVRGPR